MMGLVGAVAIPPCLWWECLFGVVLRVILVFGGFFRFVWVLFCY